MSHALVQKFERSHVFTDAEAWMLFRLAAVAEACGWTLLICGIAWQHLALPASREALLVAGRIHGLLFCGYALAAVGLYPSLGWSRRRALVALLASAPPYGSLLFERLTAHQRHQAAFNIYSRAILLHQLNGQPAQDLPTLHI